MNPDQQPGVNPPHNEPAPLKPLTQASQAASNQQPSSQKTSYPVDYLATIAPAQKAKPLSIQVIIAVIVGVLLIFSVISFLFLARSPINTSLSDKAVELNSRYTSIGSVANKYQKIIIDPKLRATNSQLTVFLANAKNNLNDTVAAQKIAVKNVTIPELVISNNKKRITALNETLNNAQINNTVDRIYAKEMAYELESIGSLLISLKNKSNNQTVQSYVTSTVDNLNVVHKSFTEFIGS